MLHSFYCWGCVGSDPFLNPVFYLFWHRPLENTDPFVAYHPHCQPSFIYQSPIYSLHEEGQSGLSLLALCRQKIFWLFVLMMICAGASEQAVSQWASAFAETGLGIKKTIGDLVGPMSFSILMGLSRLLYGKWETAWISTAV